MEPLSVEKVKRKKSKGQAQATGSCLRPSPFALGLLPLALCLAGCVNTGFFLLPGVDMAGRSPSEVVVAWHPEIISRPDPAHGGAPTPGIGGRLYLFGEGSDCPLMGEGCVVVDLYEETLRIGGTTPVPLEEWRIDKATLKRLLRRDAVGWGYTLFLPWGTYKPEITQVQLRLRYEPAKGTPLYAESSSLVFHKGEATAPPIVRRTTAKIGG
jgi:hypothetical protein